MVGGRTCLRTPQRLQSVRVFEFSWLWLQGDAGRGSANCWIADRDEGQCHHESNRENQRRDNDCRPGEWLVCLWCFEMKPGTYQGSNRKGNREVGERYKDDHA